MNCLTENGKHIFYLDWQDEENNYYKCRACECEFRIFIDERYSNGKTKDIR
jgi:hypothetical protein